MSGLRGLFITGTDTGVGKTWVTAMIARTLRAAGLRVGIYKPCCSGAEGNTPDAPVWGDLVALAEALGGDVPLDRLCPQRFIAPLAPPVAAALEGRDVDARLLRDGARAWGDDVDVLLVEGVGGWLCPLTETETVADLACDLGFPVLIVARLGLGTINHTLLTVAAVEHCRLPMAGIVLNEATPEHSSIAAHTNPAEIAKRCSAPVLGILPHGAASGLRRKESPITIDWNALAALPSRSHSGSDYAF